jgi:hypothetical protein
VVARIRRRASGDKENLRAYPDNPNQQRWKAMRAKAKWSKAM